MQTLSPLRARLASFEHAYRLATRLRSATGKRQYVITTGNLLQPVRVTDTPPANPLSVMAWVL